jgi:hypothetical protein
MQVTQSKGFLVAAIAYSSINGGESLSIPSFFGINNSKLPNKAKSNEVIPEISKDSLTNDLNNKLNTCQDEILNKNELSAESQSVLKSFEHNYPPKYASPSPYISNNNNVVRVYEDINIPNFKNGELTFKPGEVKDRFLHKMKAQGNKLNSHEDVMKNWGENNFLKEQAPDLNKEIMNSNKQNKSFIDKILSKEQTKSSREI